MSGKPRRILVPFNYREVISTGQAAKLAGVSTPTIISWCKRHGIGRQIDADGAWLVSRVALRMLLEGDHLALSSYHDGDRRSALVVTYYERENLKGLPYEWRAAEAASG